MNRTEGQDAINAVTSGDILKMESVMKRIPIKASTITKMNRISSLFSEDMGEGLKEADMIAFFLEMSFDAFLKSGEIEKRFKGLTD